MNWMTTLLKRVILYEATLSRGLHYMKISDFAGIGVNRWFHRGTCKTPFRFTCNWTDLIKIWNTKASKVAPKKEEEEREGGEDGEEYEEDHGSTLCGACGESYANDEFWICCDVCEKWFHGKCVRITPARAEHIKQYKCPGCSNNKRARAWQASASLAFITSTFNGRTIGKLGLEEPFWGPRVAIDRTMVLL